MSKGGNLLSETTAVFEVREAYPHWHRGRNQGTLPSSRTPCPNHPQVPGLNLTYVGQSSLFLKRKMSAAVQTWQGFFLEAEGQLSMNLARVAGHFSPGWIKEKTGTVEGLPQRLSSKESTCNAGDPGSIPGSERSPGEENGNPLQYSCLGNPRDRGA